MNARADREAVEAASELASLQEQVAAAREVLAGLQHAATVAEHRLDNGLAGQLVEVNGQLLSAALSAQTEADTAVHALQEASRSAGLDALTQLPNRALLLDRLTHAIAAARRHGSRVALLFMDLDNFKQINDTLGHAVGDQVLQVAAHCLDASVREQDTVSRHGGDEFLIVLEEVDRAIDAGVVADKVIAALDGPHRVAGQLLRLTASIGISIYPDHGEDPSTLIGRADAAMYRAKREGLGNFVFHQDQPVDGGSPAPSLPPPATAWPRPGGGDRAIAEYGRRHAQQQEANEQLVLAALGAQELQAAAELAQRRQTDFLAMLAHELRNPLAPIRTAAALLGRVQNDETMLPRLQAIIERQVLHMSRLVGDLLDVSRVNTGKLRLERQVVDMGGIIEQALQTCRPAMDLRLQRLGVHLPAYPLPVHGDPVRLAQVLGNLLDNASKYTPDGGEIGLSVAVVDGAVVLSVSDSGIGITEQALPEVFEAFVQDPHAIDFNGMGLGLGLTVVRELVEAHGGSVFATSAGSGLGSQFVVMLPLAKPDDG